MKLKSQKKFLEQSNKMILSIAWNHFPLPFRTINTV